MTKRAVKRFNDALLAAQEAQNTGDVAKMQHHYECALEFRDHAGVRQNLGALAQLRGDTDIAKRHYLRAIQLDSKSSRSHSNLGSIYRDEGEKALAKKHYALAMRDPSNVAGLNGMAALCIDDDRHSDALDLLGRALDREPTNSDVLTNVGTALMGLGRTSEAEQAFRAALKHGDAPKTHMYLGLLLLTLGRYNEGFPEYNYRFQALNTRMRGEGLTLWDGKTECLMGLYVWPEQGLGDEILHFGAAQHLQHYAKDVTWECDRRLVKLLERSKLENITIRARNDLEGLPERAWFQIPAACLSQLYAPWEPRTAYLTADPERVAKYKAMMPEGKRVIGLSWRSSNKDYGEKKSLELGDFSAFLDNPDFHCVSLQYGMREETEGLHHTPGLDLTNDIDGLAALMCACDLVVTVSNSAAHLAGALGRPTIVRVASGGGKLWYWGTKDRTDWYESVRIDRFDRQPIASWR